MSTFYELSFVNVHFPDNPLGFMMVNLAKELGEFSTHRGATNPSVYQKKSKPPRLEHQLTEQSQLKVYLYLLISQAFEHMTRSSHVQSSRTSEKEP